MRAPAAAAIKMRTIQCALRTLWGMIRVIRSRLNFVILSPLRLKMMNRFFEEVNDEPIPFLIVRVAHLLTPSGAGEVVLHSANTVSNPQEKISLFEATS
jgi:hypothetical protein